LSKDCADRQAINAKSFGEEGHKMEVHGEVKLTIFRPIFCYISEKIQNGDTYVNTCRSYARPRCAHARVARAMAAQARATQAIRPS